MPPSVSSRQLQGAGASPPSGSASFEYRPALDGVRAVAILAVIAFHIGPWLPGGFLGVDVFFVLSGYLITTLLLHEFRSHGRIDFFAFWTRRARRLLPALFVLLVVIAVVIRQFGTYDTFEARRQDLLATLFYYANWHFVTAAESYFATFNGASPLRHTWSLAIEEQYYLVWPMLVAVLFVLFRGSRAVLLAVTAVLFVASFGRMADAFRHGHDSLAYYGTDARAQALLAGSALALALDLRPALLRSARAERMARLAWPLVVGMIVAGFLTLRDDSRPYYYGGDAAFAIAVALGLWLIEAAPRGVPARVLTLRPVVWIGTISYALYLWHWPIVVWLGGAASLDSWDPNAVRALELVLMFGASTLSFFLVEQPVRRGRVVWVRRSARRLWPLLAAAAGAVAAVILWGTAVPPGVQAALAQTSSFSCPSGSPGHGEFLVCSRTEPSARGSLVVAVIGDSTAGALDPGMRAVAAQHGWRYVKANANGCSILPLVQPQNPGDTENVDEKRPCPNGVTAALSLAQRLWRPDVWLLSDEFPAEPILLADGRVVEPGSAEHERLIAAALRRRLRMLTADGASVVIVGVPPTGPPIECAFRDDSSCHSSKYSVRNTKYAALDALYRATARELPRVAYVSITDVVCPDDGSCPARIGGLVVRPDGTHYTRAFARQLVPIIIARASRAGAIGSS